MNAASWLEGLPPDKWRALVLAHGPRVATWTLAILLGIQAAVILTNLAGSGRTPKLALAPPPQIRNQSVDVAAITNAHLFREAPVQALPGQNAANAPQTSMPLVLTGIISADDPQNGLAILGENAAAAKVYAVGDNIPGGAKLHSVFSDRVVIDRGGNLESLYLPRQLQGGSPPPPSTAAVPTQPALDRMRRLITEDPGLLADIMRPQPVFAGGKQMKGFRVYPGRNRQAFNRLGLRPGDLVMSINGTPLDDPSRGQEIFRTLGSSSEAHITVIRGGQQQDLTLNIAQVAQEAEGLVGSQGASQSDQAQPVQPPTPEPPDTSQ